MKIFGGPSHPEANKVMNGLLCEMLILEYGANAIKVIEEMKSDQLAESSILRQLLYEVLLNYHPELDSFRKRSNKGRTDMQQQKIILEVLGTSDKLGISERAAVKVIYSNSSKQKTNWADYQRLKKRHPIAVLGAKEKFIVFQYLSVNYPGLIESAEMDDLQLLLFAPSTKILRDLAETLIADLKESCNFHLPSDNAPNKYLSPNDEDLSEDLPNFNFARYKSINDLEFEQDAYLDIIKSKVWIKLNRTQEKL